MNSVKGLKQLLVEKGVSTADTVKSFSKLKEMVNKAHAMRIPLDEEYQNGPRRAIRKTYCGSNSISGYETSTGKAGLNGMTNFLKSLPNLKSINKIEHPTELACVGLMIAVSKCPDRTACECNTRDTCNCRGDCGGHVVGCNCKSRGGNYTADCGSRTTCECDAKTIADTVKLCTCDSVVSY